MMNRNGQTLVVFVIIVPVFILLMAFVVDTGYLLKEYTRLNSTTKTVLKTTYEKSNDVNYKEMVVNLFNENKIPVNNLELSVNNEKISIKNQYSIESIFGQIIGLKEYQVKIEMSSYQKDNKIIVEKE